MIDEVQEDFIRLVRNPNWFGKKPAMDEVIFRFYRRRQSAVPSTEER